MAKGKVTIQYIRELMERQDRFRILNRLGEGAFGTVFLSEDLIYGNELIAIKFVDGGPENPKYIQREIENHRKLRHPHVIEFRRIFSLPGKLAIVMEYADGGNLFNYVKQKKRLEESLARWFFQQLMIAMDYCHRKGVANRDIKLENILLSNGELLPILKLCDFGYSKHDRHSVARTTVGSIDYMAPEVLEQHAYDAKLADVWSCGVVLYVMLVGMYPFQTMEIAKLGIDQRHNAVKKKITRLDYSIPQHLSQDCQRLLRRILVQASERITIAEIMEDPWCKKNFPPEAKSLNDRIMAMDQETMAQVEKAQSAQEISALIASVPSAIERYDPVIEEYLNAIQDGEYRQE